MIATQDSQEIVIDEFVENLLFGNKSDIFKEYCDKYPFWEKAFEQKYNLITLLDDNFDIENMVGEKIADYVIYEEIGRGGMGVVYLAWQVSLERFVALKLLPFGLSFDSEINKRFQNEAKIVARFNHPNIVPIYSYGEEKGAYYISMAFVPGLSLNKIITRLKGAVPSQVNASIVRDIILSHDDFIRFKSDNVKNRLQESIMIKRDPSFWNMSYYKFIFSIFLDILDALTYAHKNNIFHGDIKPSNIMLTADGIPMIVDFGLARDIKALVTTHSSEFLGTIVYAAPEQIEHNVINYKTDIWSLGVMLYELLSLKHPFYEENLAKSIDNVMHDDPPLIHKLNRKFSKEADAIIQKCLEKNPEKRYRDTELFKSDLNNFLDSRQISVKPIGVIGTLLKWIKRKFLIFIFILSLSITGVVSSFLYFRNTVETLINEGSVLYDRGNYIESISKYGQALHYLQMVPLSLQSQKIVLSKIGDAYYGKGEYEESERYFKKAIEIDGSYVAALSGLGQDYLEVGHYDEAIKYYKRAIMLYPNDRDTYFSLGRAYENNKMFHEAISNLHSAIKISPKDKETMLEINYVLDALKILGHKKRKEYLINKGFSDHEIEIILGDQKTN